MIAGYGFEYLFLLFFQYLIDFLLPPIPRAPPLKLQIAPDDDALQCEAGSQVHRDLSWEHRGHNDEHQALEDEERLQGAQEEGPTEGARGVEGERVGEQDQGLLQVVDREEEEET